MSDIKLVPKKKRIEVYKKAIEIIEKNEIVYELQVRGLCLLLPCILWNLKSYLDDSPRGCVWNHYDSQKMFPEITEKVIDKIKDCGNSRTVKDIERIELLKSFIAKLEK